MPPPPPQLSSWLRRCSEADSCWEKYTEFHLKLHSMSRKSIVCIVKIFRFMFRFQRFTHLGTDLRVCSAAKLLTPVDWDWDVNTSTRSTKRSVFVTSLSKLFLLYAKCNKTKRPKRHSWILYPLRWIDILECLLYYNPILCTWSLELHCMW